ncbi:ATP-dependent zinc protease [Candidatus Saccharibacteria bacterium]|nr:ATP-dependent zinc protease [Candidatus Saccharibacteria bacterium]
MSQNSHILNIIGSTEYVEVAGIKNIPAKIDTGADSSAIWASNINITGHGFLTFSLFDPKSPYYTGETLKTKDYVARSVRSSHGDTEVRYRVKLKLKIAGKTFLTNFTLANRSRNKFPVLIGRRTLHKKGFIVDVSKSSVKRSRSIASASLNKELQKDPHSFHQKYIKGATK